MIVIWIVIALFCAVQCAHTTSLLISSLWLGGVSVAVALLLYMIGAHAIAVIELSVGAGLTMVLLVFAITVIGDSTAQIPKTDIVYLLIIMVIVIGLIILTLPELEHQPMIDSGQLVEIMWHERALDVVLQITLLFSGALTVLALLNLPEKKVQVDDMEVNSGTIEHEDDCSPNAPLMIAEVRAELEKELI